MKKGRDLAEQLLPQYPTYFAPGEEFIFRLGKGSQPSASVACR
jgi:hypothetical protein